ncbi:unnamed protein product [Microthlaspi erraticum]|uniref:Uncharacterized protein n=1 Tax=Microthlaspi erraticum TaxID=1685480 RepID=A0A6D2HZ04_9BRAS|nr:unnamed protein product [Microthlaspi erraticum]
MVSKIKSLEKKVSGSSSKKKKAPMAPTFPRSRSLLTTQGGSLPKSLTEPLHFEPREGGDNTQREEEFQGALQLDRVSSTRAEVELTWRSPCSRTLDSSTIQPTRTSSEPWTPTTASSEHSSTKAKEPHHFEMKKRKKREQARSS